MRTKSGGQKRRVEVYYQVRRARESGSELRVVGLRIAGNGVRKASDYVRKQGKVRENEWQRVSGAKRVRTGVNQVYSAR